MLRGERPTIYGDGEQSRDFNYIDNAVCGEPAGGDRAGSRCGREDVQYRDRTSI